eukprot:g10405.t1
MDFDYASDDDAPRAGEGEQAPSPDEAGNNGAAASALVLPAGAAAGAEVDPSAAAAGPGPGTRGTGPATSAPPAQEASASPEVVDSVLLQRRSLLTDFYRNYHQRAAASNALKADLLEKQYTAAEALVFLRSSVVGENTSNASNYAYGSAGIKGSTLKSVVGKAPPTSVELKCLCLVRLYELVPLQTKQEYADHSLVTGLCQLLLKELRAYSNTQTALKAIGHPDLVDVIHALFSILALNAVPTFREKIQFQIAAHVDTKQLLSLRKLGLSVPEAEVDGGTQAVLSRFLSSAKSGGQTGAFGEGGAWKKITGTTSSVTSFSGNFRAEQLRAQQSLPYLAFVSRRLEHLKVAFDYVSVYNLEKICVLAMALRWQLEKYVALGADMKRRKKMLAIEPTSAAEDGAASKETRAGGDNKEEELKMLSTTNSPAALTNVEQALTQESEDSDSIDAAKILLASFRSRLENVISVTHDYNDVRLELLAELLLVLSDRFILGEDSSSSSSKSNAPKAKGKNDNGIASSGINSLLTATVRIYEEHVAYCLRIQSAAKDKRLMKKLADDRVDPANWNSMSGVKANKAATERLAKKTAKLFGDGDEVMGEILRIGLDEVQDRQ